MESRKELRWRDATWMISIHGFGRTRVYLARENLLLEFGIPVVFDVVIGSSRKLRRDDRPSEVLVKTY